MYKKEELIFLNMETIERSREKVFSIEDKLSIKEKITFIDELENGIATYLLNIFDKWEKERDSLPKDYYGSTKTVSKKAWIKRNDSKKIINTDDRIGTYRLFNTKYLKMSTTCPEGYYRTCLYTGEHVVNQWFHDLCTNLYWEEQKYFKTIDPVSIKIKKVKEYAEYLNTCLDIKKLNDIVWNDDTNVTEEELNIYLEAYKKIEEYIDNITNTTKEQIDNLHRTK